MLLVEIVAFVQQINVKGKKNPVVTIKINGFCFVLCFILICLIGLKVFANPTAK